MELKTGLAALALAALAGCGGDYSVSIGGGALFIDDQFVVWGGNSNRDQVVDADNDVFAFFADSGCLYNFRTGLENTEFCLTSAGDTARVGRFRVRIVIVRSFTGACIAALVDEDSARFIDIETDPFRREIIVITDLRPEFCFA